MKIYIVTVLQKQLIMNEIKKISHFLFLYVNKFYSCCFKICSRKFKGFLCFKHETTFKQKKTGRTYDKESLSLR